MTYISMLCTVTVGYGNNITAMLAGTVVAVPVERATEFCLREWAIPVEVLHAAIGPSPRKAGAAVTAPSFKERA